MSSDGKVKCNHCDTNQWVLCECCGEVMRVTEAYRGGARNIKPKGVGTPYKKPHAPNRSPFIVKRNLEICKKRKQGLTLESIAIVYGISRERVRQIVRDGGKLEASQDKT